MPNNVEELLEHAKLRLRWLKRAAVACQILCLAILLNDLASPGRSWPPLLGLAFALVQVRLSVWVASKNVQLFAEFAKGSDEAKRQPGVPCDA